MQEIKSGIPVPWDAAVGFRNVLLEMHIGKIFLGLKRNYKCLGSRLPGRRLYCDTGAKF
jgi:hypothetical protein